MRLEMLCKQLYESHNPEDRSIAEKSLMEFQNSSDSLPKCRLLLERGDSPYAQLLAAHTLTKLVSKTTSTIPLEQRLEISQCHIDWTHKLLTPSKIFQNEKRR
jgi:exportin-7